MRGTCPDFDSLTPAQRNYIRRLEQDNETLRRQAPPCPVIPDRRAGVLLHITSLPITLGSGDLHNEAYDFIDFMKECGLSVWQMLPIHPPQYLPIGYPQRNLLSPYQPQCVHAGNPALINLEWLMGKGWLSRLPKKPDSLETLSHTSSSYTKIM
ncbi:4-alpha-glucanotransferase [Thioflexithrix psekupsensis]|uniref:4-alpha-glucanotransferase n=1 Tax=Thioflexithrix psekupsensis TaxID=1570016 RepID=A0A251X6U8_9GAMM|nr:4-alpha-glucanotransferase [Thioflexithrix psekupsensis]OUD13342.1 hypothetical protein TPSD3_12025 [Thioflexithrix psekupsensis]